MKNKQQERQELLEAILKDLQNVPGIDKLDFSGVADYDPYTDPESVENVCKATFVNEVLIAMEKQGYSRSDLAEKMGKKPAFVSRVLNETSNFQIKTMAEFACALNMNLCIRLYEHDQRPVFLDTDESVVKTADLEKNGIPAKSLGFVAESSAQYDATTKVDAEPLT